MAIFDSSNKGADGTSQTTIIADGTKINGEIEIDTPLNIFGKFIGNIQSKSVVTIGTKGFSSGNIYASKLIINGAFDGEASCESVEILENGVANGVIETNRLIIEDGGFFEGESKRMDKSKTKDTSIKEINKSEVSKEKDKNKPK